MHAHTGQHVPFISHTFAGIRLQHKCLSCKHVFRRAPAASRHLLLPCWQEGMQLPKAALVQQLARIVQADLPLIQHIGSIAAVVAAGWCCAGLCLRVTGAALCWASPVNMQAVLDDSRQVPAGTAVILGHCSMHSTAGACPRNMLQAHASSHEGMASCGIQRKYTVCWSRGTSAVPRSTPTMLIHAAAGAHPSDCSASCASCKDMGCCTSQPRSMALHRCMAW